MLRIVVLFCLLTFILGHVTQKQTLDLYELQSSQSMKGRSAFHKRALKIANGHSIPSDVDQRFPYSVLLVFGNSETETSEPRICAGVLIQSQWVLTAGSCVLNIHRLNEIYVGFGDDARPADLLGSEDARLVRGLEVFPAFNGDPRGGSDLALLYLRQPVNRTLPVLPMTDDGLGEGQRLVGLGWGVTEVNSNSADRLQVADRFIFMDHTMCANIWDDANKVDAVIDERVICVYPRDLAVNEASVSICDGDEGGPLLVLDTDSFNVESQFTFGGDPAVDVVYGIASFGPNTCGEEELSVYTNIAEYMDWIDQTIRTYVPPSLNAHEPSEQPEDDDDNTTEMIIIVVGVVCGIVAVALLLVCVVHARLRRPGGSSKDGTSISLRLAEQSDRRQHQIALMSLSPFLTTPDQVSSPNSSAAEGNSSQTHQRLPINIRATLSGRQLGSGAFGRVEEGSYTDQDGIRHKVAVKFNFGEEKSKETLLNEIRIFERVGPHPNIVRCFGGHLSDSINDEQEYCIIEELMANDLGQCLKDPRQRKKINFSRFLETFLGIANGLEHLHKCEVIHFDLKPSNILLDDKMHPKLADFGCSRQRAHSYITAGARGTVAYMAPELWLLGMYVKRAQVKAEKVDIFSFGVVMWEVFNNKNPKDPLSMKELLDSDTQQPSDIAATEGGTNEDFRNDRFPFESARCPDPLKALIWDCVSYYNNLRPTVQEVKQRLMELGEMPWVHQNIDQYQR